MMIVVESVFYKPTRNDTERPIRAFTLWAFTCFPIDDIIRVFDLEAYRNELDASRWTGYKTIYWNYLRLFVPEESRDVLDGGSWLYDDITVLQVLRQYRPWECEGFEDWLIECFESKQHRLMEARFLNKRHQTAITTTTATINTTPMYSINRK